MWAGLFVTFSHSGYTWKIINLILTPYQPPRLTFFWPVMLAFFVTSQKRL